MALLCRLAEAWDVLVVKVHLGCACRVEQQPWVWLFSASATDRSQSCCVLQVSYAALQPPGLGLLLSACTRSSTLSLGTALMQIAMHGGISKSRLREIHNPCPMTVPDTS